MTAFIFLPTALAAFVLHTHLVTQIPKRRYFFSDLTFLSHSSLSLSLSFILLPRTASHPFSPLSSPQTCNRGPLDSPEFLVPQHLLFSPSFALFLSHPLPIYLPLPQNYRTLSIAHRSWPTTTFRAVPSREFRPKELFARRCGFAKSKHIA